MILPELETQLQALTPAERADAIQILTQTLSTRSQGITKTPDVVGEMLVLRTHTFPFGYLLVCGNKAQRMQCF